MRFASLLVFLVVLHEQVFAQCSLGTPVYKGCFGIDFHGCCTLKETPAGTVTTVQWCENGYLCSMICNPFSLYPVCGWVVDPNTGIGLYDCTTQQTQDPSGKYPYLCYIPCGSVTEVGCCEGKTLLKYCKAGSLNLINCAANTDPKYQYCGWDPVYKAYACTVAPVEGPTEYPYTCDAAACTPSCAGKQCGPDGCGGVCGTCPTGYACSQQGTCVPAGCQPNCAGKDCGPDGCGGSCGECYGNMVCNEEQKCVAPICVPDCKNKECGPDLCGGTCGVCPPPKECSPYFKCVVQGEDVGLPPADVVEQHLKDAFDFGDPANHEPPARPDAEPPVLCPPGSTQSYGRCVPVSGGDAAHAKKGGGCHLAGTVEPAVLFILFGSFMLLLRRGKQ